jgi:hypothetical protein
MLAFRLGYDCVAPALRSRFARATLALRLRCTRVSTALRLRCVGVALASRLQCACVALSMHLRYMRVALLALHMCCNSVALPLRLRLRFDFLPCVARLRRARIAVALSRLVSLFDVPSAHA